MQKANPVINLDTYNFLKENLAEILPELKSAFLEDGFILLEKIDANLPCGDYEVINHAAHTLKSSAQNIGADTLAEYCAKIEQQTTNSAEILQNLYQQAFLEMQRVQVYLDTHE